MQTVMSQRLQTLCCFLQELISHRMPIGIIDGLEMIQIQIHQNEGQLLFLFTLQHHREIALIEKSGQSIGIRQCFQIMLFPDILTDAHHFFQHALFIPGNRHHRHKPEGLFLAAAALKAHEIILRFQNADEVLFGQQLADLHMLRIPRRDKGTGEFLHEQRETACLRIQRFLQLILPIVIPVRLQIGHDEAIRHAPHPSEKLPHHLFLAREHLLLLLLLMKSLPSLLDGHPDHEKGQE